MPDEPAFGEQDYADRLGALRTRMAERSLDLCFFSTPENIYYLTGLDHWGYFAPHLLIVPPDGAPVLITRAMERVTIENQVRGARFAGHRDDESVADVALRELGGQAGRRLRIGIESWSAGLPHGLAAGLKAGLPQADWIDVTGLVEALRIVKSPAEQAAMRAAARVSDAAMQAALEAIHDGAAEQEVAAECHRAMIRAGGTYPGFGPFIRPASRLGEEHTSWGGGAFKAGDMVFLELAGCVRRYHAPMGRVVFIGDAPDSARAISRVCHEAFAAVVAAMRPGVPAREVYAAWQGVVDRAGLAHYRRHHCGYVVGIGFPPSWTGGNSVTGLRDTADWTLQAGMTFHVLSWLIGSGRGDYFLSNTVLLGEDGAEVLTTLPSDVVVR